MEKKFIILVILVVVVAGAWMFLAGKSGTEGVEQVETASSTTEASGKQVIEIFAKGGYSPRQVKARAGEESVLRVKTQNTFDCSTALVIPSLSYQAQLKPTGIVDIPLPAQEPGSKLVGLCSMGMYSFEVTFQ